MTEEQREVRTVADGRARFRGERDESTDRRTESSGDGVKRGRDRYRRTRGITDEKES